MRSSKFRVLFTAFIGIVVLVSLALLHPKTSTELLFVRPGRFPSFGNPQAEIEIVAFEDFRCSHCRIFSETVFPQIQVLYIETGKVHYTLVPLAFLQGSKPITNAALAVYKQSPHKFFPYVQELLAYEEEEIDPKILLRAAKKVGGIDMAKLEWAIKEKSFYKELDRNLEWAKRVMKSDFGTPALYVNGTPVSTASFEEVKTQIEQLFKEKKQ